MSRLKHFSRNLAVSYLQLGVNVIYSLVSVPLILYWLPRAEFGMWAVLVQLMGYVSLIDLGMTSAASRLLVDYKDRRSDGGYGSLIQTAFLVSLSQGVLILAAVTFSAPLLASLMKIPAEYQPTFIALMRWQGAVTAVSFCLRPLTLMLSAYQRLDVCSAGESISACTSLGLLVLFLLKGCGIYSFVYAATVTAVVSPAWLLWNCWRLDFLPRTGEWGHATWKMFIEVFNYGKDVFLFSLGGQLIISSQTIIVSRFLGLDMAAAWSVGTKMFNLCMPLVLRPMYVSLSALSEMVVREEVDRLRSRFKGLVVLIGSLGIFLGVSYVLCNSLFVGIWTHGRIMWPALNDLLLAVWLVLISMQTVHCNFVFVIKQIGGARYILFAEGITFVALAALVGSHWGLPGIIATSVVCTTVFSWQYSVRRSRNYFHCGWWEVATGWVRPCLKLALVYGGVAAMVWLATSGLPPLVRLCLHAFVAATIGGILFLRLGFPPEMIREIAGRLPQPVAKGLRFFAHAGGPDRIAT